MTQDRNPVEVVAIESLGFDEVVILETTSATYLANGYASHNCPFHDDRHRSASWQPETGVFYCHAETRNFTVPELVKHFGIALNGSASNGHAPPTRLRARARERQSEPRTRRRKGDPEPEPPPRIETVWEYVTPDGRVTHRKHRYDYGGPCDYDGCEADGPHKHIDQEGPQGERSLAGLELWPIYGDHGLARGCVMLVVEGEKKVDIVNGLGLSFEGAQVRAVTCGSSSDHMGHAKELASRLRDLEPSKVLLWPDHDDPGRKAMQEVARALREVGIAFKRVNPTDYNLAEHQDVADFLAQGGDLQQVWLDHFTARTTLSVLQLLDRLAVTADQLVLFGRNPRQITVPNCQALWLDEYGALPHPKQLEEFRARLLLKANQAPTRLAWRLYTEDQAFWWRPATNGPCFQVTPQGVAEADDPGGRLLLVPEEEPLYPAAVDLSGEQRDLDSIADLFNLSETERAMCEGWLISAFCGLQTPILFMRGDAGTGKTTLARFLLSCLEPICPAIEASRSRSTDARQLVLTLKRAPGIVLDNVSSLDSETEDLLSQLVTGYTRAHRPLYEERVEFLSMKRAVIITSTNYDVYKGDLASRMVVVQPRLNGGWRSEDHMHRELAPHMARIRGWVMKEAVNYYRSDHALEQPFRIGSLGHVFQSLGYDVAMLAREESTQRTRVIGINDPWLEAIVDLWEQEGADMFLKTGAEILGHMKEFDVPDLPPVRSPKLARWFGEKGMILRDHGFQVEPVHGEKYRGWRFSAISR